MPMLQPLYQEKLENVSGAPCELRTLLAGPAAVCLCGAPATTAGEV